MVKGGEAEGEGRQGKEEREEWRGEEEEEGRRAKKKGGEEERWRGKRMGKERR